MRPELRREKKKSTLSHLDGIGAVRKLEGGVPEPWFKAKGRQGKCPDQDRSHLTAKFSNQGT